ncbi:MAG TPA: type I methionyl aminopeptidase [Verrucomicrobiae bacterium]|nr:type I methionyl aminopeptidase [Verrucomicrobiae bacterium]
MITKNPSEIKALKAGGKILASTLKKVSQLVKPGISAFELNEFAEKEIKSSKAIGSFKNYKTRGTEKPFPSALCVSINDEVVHGIPKKTKIIKEGDIVGLDLGILYQGFYTDGAISVPVGNVPAKHLKLLKITETALYQALDEVKAGARIGDISFAIQSIAEGSGYQVVKELVGHGVGRAVHEDPDIPCYGRPGTGAKLVEGMVLAIEPMVNEGHWRIKIASDGWTVKTLDKSISCHFEHTILVTKSGCEIITQE